MAETYDFGGYATMNDMLCSDGRVIRSGAFIDQNRTRVPLVWQHQRDNIENVLGHADLEARADGVYCRCKFNNTKKAQIAKALVEHRDLNSLSIFATRLMQKGRDVLHGEIQEVSLVLAGANPGAVIDSVYMEHSDGHVYEQEDEFILRCGEEIEVNDDMDYEDFDDEVEHADKNQNGGKTMKEILDTLTKEQKEAVYVLLGMALNKTGGMLEDDDDEDVEHSDLDGDLSYLNPVLDTLNDEQHDAVHALLGLALSENSMEHSDDDVDLDEDFEYEDDDPDDDDLDYDLLNDDDADLDEDFEYEDDDLDHGDSDFDENYIKHSDEEGESIMNIFENGMVPDGEVLEHAEALEIIHDIPKYGTLKNSMLEHGITDIEVMFPDARSIDPTPAMISRDMAWVTDLLNGIKKTPFSRIKSIAVNMTADEARAKGYIKGKKKLEEQIAAIKRVTTPQTVYKKQSLDRDDIIDITDFDVVSFMRAEMRVMLNEELARAALIGDGRSISAEDKINPVNIRPIYTDDEVYTIHYEVTLPTSGDVTETSNAIVDAANFARIDYKGSGTPTLYADPKTITTLLMARDKIGNRMYRTMQDLAAAMRVSKIVEVPVMENISRDADGTTMNLLGIIVNPSDYTFGADKGGNVTMFDDFDIDYNKEKYLIETRVSGALHRPKSAIVLEAKAPKTSSGGTGGTGSQG